MSASSAGTTAAQRAELTDLLGGLSHRFRTAPEGSAVAAVAHAAVFHVPGARWAAVTLLRQGRARPLAVTGPVATEAESLQHDLGSGPSLDPGLEGQAHLARHLARDRRWPDFGAQVQDQLGVASLLAYRLPLPEDTEATVGLTLYSDTVDAFDAQALWAGAVLASQAALAVAAGLHHRQREDWDRALASNRAIGAAVGVLMARHKTTREAAFDLLREVSQTTNRKLAQIAEEVLLTGELPTPPTPLGARPRRSRSDGAAPAQP